MYFKTLNLWALLLVCLISACSTGSTRECAPLTLEPLPDELTPIVGRMLEAKELGDLEAQYTYNMAQAGMCYMYYESLVDAIREREEIYNAGQPED